MDGTDRSDRRLDLLERRVEDGFARLDRQAREAREAAWREKTERWRVIDGFIEMAIYMSIGAIVAVAIIQR